MTTDAKIQRRRILSKASAGTRPGNLLFNDFYNLSETIRRRLDQLITQRRLIYGSKGRLRPSLAPFDMLLPWWSTRVATDRTCVLYHDVLFTYFDFIPKACRQCWKTVILTHEDPEKQRVSDLFRLRDILQGMALPSKCGVDLRVNTPNRYAGFIYGDSIEQAGVYWDLAREAMKEFKGSKVVVKRGCTEFEDRFGDSSKWDELAKTHAFDVTEHYLNHIIEPYDEFLIEGLFMHKDAETFRFWIEHAHGIGDSTWRQALEDQGYEVPETLFFKPKLYYEE